MRLVLVYQAGIANVFKVDRFSAIPERSGNVVRMYQGAFHSCAMFATGAGYAGARVRTAHCDQTAGDCAGAIWQGGRGDMFRDKRQSVRF